MNKVYVCVTGLLLCWGAALATGQEPKQFDKGLIFVKDTDILVSGDNWTIAVNIALDDYTVLISTMKLVLGQIRHTIQAHRDPHDVAFKIHWEEISRLEKIIDELQSDLKGFRQLLYDEESDRNPMVPGVRSKRGLIDVLGYGLKYLFGTADAKDVKRLAAICEELHAFKAQMVHAADQQLTYMRAVDEVTKQNNKDTIDLARALRDSIRNFSVQLNKGKADLLDIQAVIKKQVRYSAAIREVEMAILEIKFSLTQLKESLDLTSLGKLSSVLINPYNMSVILQQVSLQLPPGMSMLTGLTVEDMYLPYMLLLPPRTFGYLLISL